VSEPRERLRPISGGALTGWGIAGLIAGWLLRRVSESWWGSAPVVTWLQPLALLVVALIIGGTAWATRRSLDGKAERIGPLYAVNRLVLGRTCALVGALVAGGYAGYALSWLGISGDPLAGQRVLRSAISAVLGVGILVAGILLERACRVRGEDTDGS
jgi:small-conductance mechanosensitive channel